MKELKSSLVKNINSISQIITMTIATPCVVSLKDHGFVTGQTIFFSTTGALPTGVVIGTIYYVIYKTDDTFNLASSYANAISGTKINTTGIQSGVHSVNIEDPLAVTVAEIGEWLNIGSDATAAYNLMLKNLIRQVTQTIEKYTWFDLIQKTYINYYKGYIGSETKLMLDRSPILNISDVLKIEYLNENDEWTELEKGSEIEEGIYDNVIIQFENLDYMSITIKADLSLSSISDIEKIRITFLSGYNIFQVNNIPEDLKTAIKKIVAYNYTNRGDDVKQVTILNGLPIPLDALMIIENYNRAKVNLTL